MAYKYTENDVWDIWGSPRQKEIIKQLLRDTAQSLVYPDSLNKNIKNVGIRSRFYGMKLPGMFSEFVYPDGFAGTYKPIRIFTDGNIFKTNFNQSKFKYTGGTTYYVATNGVYTNDGLSPGKPITLYNALTRSVATDTIIIMAGIYYVDNLQNFPYNLAKSVNIIGEDGAVLVDGYNRTYTYDAAKGLYTFPIGNIGRIIDITFDDYAFEYKLASSLSECQATKNSWFLENNTTIYINATSDPSGKAIMLPYADTFKVEPVTNIKLYMENLTIIGGNQCFTVNQNPDYNLEIILNKVKCYYNTSLSKNAFRFAGGNILLYKCEAKYAKSDGFSYATYNDSGQKVVTNFVEIECIGANNGIGNTNGPYQNGSTAHDGIKGIRVNGLYYGNNGGNVADVQPGTQTVNMACAAPLSASVDPAYNQGFSTQQSGAEMWLFGCTSYGNVYDLYIYGNSKMHADKCAYDTKMVSTGAGTIFESTNELMY